MLVYCMWLCVSVYGCGCMLVSVCVCVLECVDVVVCWGCRCSVCMCVCVCMYGCVESYNVMRCSVSSCLLSDGCLNLICKLSSRLSVWRSFAVAIILKFSGSISWWRRRECSRMAEYGGALSRAPVRSLRPRCWTMRFVRLHVVCPTYDAAEQRQLYW